MKHVWKAAAAALCAVLAVSAGCLTAFAAEEPTTAAAETTVSAASTTKASETTAITTVSTTTKASETTAVTTVSTTTKASETTAVTTVSTTTAAETTTETAADPTEPAETTADTTPVYQECWEQHGTKRCYRLSDGSLAVGEVLIDGVPYLFGYSGAQKTDWQTVLGRRYYYDPESGEPVFGWFEYFGETYYISREAGKLTGAQQIGGEHYTFEEDGSLLTGHFTLEDTLYYSAPDNGVCRAGVYQEGYRSFLTDDTGAILTGWQEFDGKRYYIEENGFIKVGFFEVDGAYYYATGDGLQYGVQQLDVMRCYFDPQTGALCTGLYSEDGTLHYFDTETMRAKRNDFAVVDGVTYYFGEDGAAVTGLQTIGDELYCFDENGVMLTGAMTIDGRNYYFTPENGAALKGALVTENGTVRYGQDGAQVFGWEEVGENKYYTDENGYVIEGWTLLIDKEYKFDAEGLMISDGRLYNQYDPKWKEVKFGSTDSTSMYSSACGIFSFCNAIFAMNHIEADAVEVAEWAIGIKAFRPGGGGTYREILYNNIEAQYGEKLQFTLGPQIWGKITDQRLIDHLLSGGVAAIHVKGHFMAVTGYNPETGLYHVLESAVNPTKRGLEGDSWVTAAKMSSGYTNVDWFVLISPRTDIPAEEPAATE